MEYIYRMSIGMYWRTVADAYDCGMTVEEFVSERFGFRGKCVKIEVAR